MVATIPATNKWLLTKQGSVALSAEQWQAWNSAETEVVMWAQPFILRIPQCDVWHEGHPDTQADGGDL